jgi:hypothetical protein
MAWPGLWHSISLLLLVAPVAIWVRHTPATTNPYVSCQQCIHVSCIVLSGHLSAVAIWQAQVALKQHV